MPRCGASYRREAVLIDLVRDHRRVTDEPVDEIDSALADLESELATIADVDREAQMPGFFIVRVTPRNPQARSIIWTCLGSEIILEAGTFGGRWELQRTQADIRFMTRVVRSVVAGRVRETFGRRRSQVEVTLDDGTTVSETGYEFFVPIPGWKRRGRTVEYESYTS